MGIQCTLYGMRACICVLCLRKAAHWVQVTRPLVQFHIAHSGTPYDIYRKTAHLNRITYKNERKNANEKKNGAKKKSSSDDDQDDNNTVVVIGVGDMSFIMFSVSMCVCVLFYNVMKDRTRKVRRTKMRRYNQQDTKLTLAYRHNPSHHITSHHIISYHITINYNEDKLTGRMKWAIVQHETPESTTQTIFSELSFKKAKQTCHLPSYLHFTACVAYVYYVQRVCALLCWCACSYVTSVIKLLEYI